MKVFKYVALILLIMTTNRILSEFEIERPGVGGAPAGKQPKATAEDVILLLSTRFGGLFPTTENLLLIDFNKKHTKEARDSWNKRVDEWTDIVKNLYPGYAKEADKLKLLSYQLLYLLDTNFKSNIKPTIKEDLSKRIAEKEKSGRHYYLKVEELSFLPDTLDNINKQMVELSKIFEQAKQIKKDVEKTSILLASKNKKKARELLIKFSDFIIELSSKISNSYNALPGRMKPMKK